MASSETNKAFLLSELRHGIWGHCPYTQGFVVVNECFLFLHQDPRMMHTLEERGKHKHNVPTRRAQRERKPTALKRL